MARSRTMKNQRGQVLIVVILILLISSVVVLAVASRSLTDLRISTTSEESARAFSSAEAGVEAAVEVINTQVAQGSIAAFSEPNPIRLPSNATYTYNVDVVGGSQDFLFPNPLISDLDTFSISLSYEGVNYNTDWICLLWGTEGSNDDTAIEASVIYESGQIYRVERKAFGTVNGVTLGTASAQDCSLESVEGSNNLGITRRFRYAHKLNLDGTIANRKALRIRILNSQRSDQYVGVHPLTSLPSQGHTITSTGRTDGGTTRRVVVFRSFAAVPGIFDYVLYSGTGLSR